MGAVAVHHTDTSKGAWDSATEVSNLGTAYTQADLKDVYAWGPDDADDAKSKTNWKLPHHEVSADGTPGAANVAGCQSAIGVLNGAMGGADIPDGDRQGVYDHLAAHLKDADVEPAELKSGAEAAEIRAAEAAASQMASGVMTIDEARAALNLPLETGGFVPGPGSVEVRLNGDFVLPASLAADLRANIGRTSATAVATLERPDLSARAAHYAKTLGRERRNTPYRDVELRAVPNGSGGSMYKFTGYACVTETGYEMCDWLGPFTEVVRRGAFAKTLNEGADVAFLINHGGMTLARTKPGTLRLSEDDTGLYTEADLDPANPDVQALASAMNRGDIDEMSFAFWVMRQQWSPDFDQRDILEVSLNKGDVSAVNYGANPNTSGQMNARELASHLAQMPEPARREVYDRLAAEFGDQTPLLLTDATSMRAWIAAKAAEVREGKQLSAATMDVLAQVLDLVAEADRAVDAAQPMLADLMGVPNPDDDDEMPEDQSDDADSGTAQQNSAVSVDMMRRRARALDLNAA